MTQLPDNMVAAYKRVLQTVCDNRPSGTRGRLATALGTNRSFVSQLANPAYTMPIPAQHLETIFGICHFSPGERAAFLHAYAAAHPGRLAAPTPAAQTRVISVTVPDLGDARRNRAVEEAVAEFAEIVERLLALPDRGGVP